MMNYKLCKVVSPLLLICFCFIQYKKTSSTQEDQLPPATQTGANTFGCKINGYVFVPKGYSGTGIPNPHVIFDNGLNNLPYLQIDATQYSPANISEGYIIISIGSIRGSGNYASPTNFNFFTGWQNIIGNCHTIAFDSTIKKWGNATITKYDPSNRIISGSFAYKFKTINCDTIFVTDGRFDFKL